MTSAASLDRVLAALKKGRPLSREETGPAIEAIEGYLSGEALKVAPGQRSWATQQAIAERDRLLVEAASRFYSDRTVNGQARAISEALDRYRASSWRHDRHAAKCPRSEGSREALFWQVFKAIDRSLKPSGVRRILSLSSCFRIATSPVNVDENQT
jgi:hypothetical protein